MRIHFLKNSEHCKSAMNQPVDMKLIKNQKLSCYSPCSTKYYFYYSLLFFHLPAELHTTPFFAHTMFSSGTLALPHLQSWAYVELLEPMTHNPRPLVPYSRKIDHMQKLKANLKFQDKRLKKTNVQTSPDLTVPTTHCPCPAQQLTKVSVG